MNLPSIILSLPNWIESFIKNWDLDFSTDENRMRFVIALAKQNIINKTGGPFASAIFDKSTNTLIAPGVNVVIPSSCSLAHAEMMAIGVAQKKLNTFNLGAPGLPICELYASTAPCAMCLGAIPWSGVRRLICAARDEDARSIGFDEGAKIKNWTEELQFRGIDVRTDLLRDEAVNVLKLYASNGGLIYNGRDI